jgi:signal transduction histidine kinase
MKQLNAIHWKANRDHIIIDSDLPELKGINVLEVLTQPSLIAGQINYDHFMKLGNETIPMRSFLQHSKDEQGIHGISVPVLKEKELESELLTNTHFHETVGKVCAELISASRDSYDKALQFMLQEIGQLLQVDRSYIFKFTEDKLRASNTHEWCAEGIEPMIEHLQDFDVNPEPWWINLMLTGQTMHVANVDSMPPEAPIAQEFFKSQQIKSVLNVPIFINKTCWGLMGFDAVSAHRDWSIFQVKYLKIISDLMSEAQRRIIAEEENARIQKKLLQSNKMASIGVLSAGMAHEINNPLTILYGSLHALKRKDTSGAHTDVYNKMEKSIQRISTIILELKKFTEKTSNPNELVDFNEAISMSILDLEAMVEEKNLKVNLQSVEGEALIKGSFDLAKQLISILLKNAIEASHDKGEIQLRLKKEENQYIFEIQDFGVGIDDKDKDKIFEAFYTTKDVGSGMGLGLFIAYNIIGILNGEIQVQSVKDKGTTMTLSFEVAEEMIDDSAA